MKRTKTRNRPTVKGRSENEPTRRFVKLEHRLMLTPAYRALSPLARALLIELIMLENGKNNGSLYLSIRDAADRLGISDLTTIRIAFDELIDLGFIAVAAEGYFSMKASETSRARRWRLTWLGVPGVMGPTNDFLRLEPEPKTKARKRMERGMRALKRYRKERDSGRLPVLETRSLEQSGTSTRNEQCGNPIRQIREVSGNCR